MLTQWWDENLLKCLPHSLCETTKSCMEMIQIQDSQEEMIDVYYDYYRYYKHLIDYFLITKDFILFSDLTNYHFYQKFTLIKSATLFVTLCHILQLISVLLL